MNDEPQYEITLAGYQALGPKPTPPPCGQCDFCVCVDKESGDE